MTVFKKNCFIVIKNSSSPKIKFQGVVKNKTSVVEKNNKQQKGIRFWLITRGSHLSE